MQLLGRRNFGIGVLGVIGARHMVAGRTSRQIGLAAVLESLIERLPSSALPKAGRSIKQKRSEL